MSALRGRSYREALDHLTGEQWAYAVHTAIRVCRWFPTVAELLEFADGMPRPELPLLGAPECDRCRGSGFEIVAQQGRDYARRCVCRAVVAGEPAAAGGRI